jgi:BNR repeat protein
MEAEMGDETCIKGEIEEHTVCSNCGLFPVLDRLSTGELAVIVRDTPHHSFTSPAGLELYVSADGGATWTRRSTISHEYFRDCRNPAFGVLADGTLVLGVASFPRGAGQAELYFTRSADGGLSWDDLQALPLPSEVSEASTYAKIVQRPDGVALMAVYAHQEQRSYFCRSGDSGCSWGDYSLISSGEISSETALLPMDDEGLIAVVRSRQENGVYGTGEALFQTRSADGGETWATPERVTLDQQHPGDLIRLKDGCLLLTYGNRIDGNLVVEANLPAGSSAFDPGVGTISQDSTGVRSRNGARILISRDNGSTWGPEGGIGVWEGCMSDDCGYPSSVELDDGTIVTVFYEETVRRKNFRAVALRYALEIHRA